VLWSDEELRQSVEVYILLLRLQQLGREDRSEPVAQAMLRDTLSQRNDAAIRYRFRNISAVLRDLGAPILRNFTPAEAVGASVRQRIRSILLDDPGFARIRSQESASAEEVRKGALLALRVLRERVEDLERELTWRGHNGPPDQEDLGIDGIDLTATREDIAFIEEQLESGSPDNIAIASRTSRILDLGLKLAKWLGERATKFADAALLAAAPVAVAKVSGLLPSIVNAVEAIGRAVG
jgi:hypothetical protein